MPYPNEQHLIDLQAQKLQEIIRSLPDSWSAKDLVTRGVIVNLNSNAQEYHLKALEYLSNCIHYASANNLKIFSIHISEGSEFDCCYESDSGDIYNQKGVKMFSLADCQIDL